MLSTAAVVVAAPASTAQASVSLPLALLANHCTIPATLHPPAPAASPPAAPHSFPLPAAMQTTLARAANATSRSALLAAAGAAPVTLASANSYSHGKRQSTLGAYLTGRDMDPVTPDRLATDTWYLFGDTYTGAFAQILEGAQYSLPFVPPDHEPLAALGVGGGWSGVGFHTHGPAVAHNLHGRKRWFVSPPSAGNSPPCFDPAQHHLQWVLKHDAAVSIPVLVPETAACEEGGDFGADVERDGLLVTWSPAQGAAWASVAAEEAAATAMCQAAHACAAPVHEVSHPVSACPSTLRSNCSCGGSPARSVTVDWKWAQLSDVLGGAELQAALLEGVAAWHAGGVGDPRPTPAALDGLLRCLARGTGACAEQAKKLASEVKEASPGACQVNLVQSCTLGPEQGLYVPGHWWHATLNVQPFNAFVSTFTREPAQLDEL